MNLPRVGVEGVLLLSTSSERSCRGGRNDGRIPSFVGFKEGAGLAMSVHSRWLKQGKTVRLQFVQDCHASNEQDQKFQ